MEEVYPENKEMIYNIGDWSFHDRKFRTAVDYLEKVLKLDPLHERAFQHLSWTYASLGYLDKMGEIAHQYKKINEIEGAVLLGQYYTTVGEYTSAETTFARVLEVEPEHETAMMRLALLYGETDRQEESIEYAKRFASIASSRMSSLILGYAYNGAGEYKKGLKKLQKARELTPYDHDITGAIAFLYLRQGYYENAREEIETLLEVDQQPQVKQRGYDLLVRYHIFRGMYREALTLYDESIALNWQLNDTTGVAADHLDKGLLMMMGWDDRAGFQYEIHEAEKYQDQMHRPGYWGSVSLSRILLGEYEEAKEIADKRLGELPWLGDLVNLFIQYEKQDCAGAESIYNSRTNLFPGGGRVTALYLLANCQLEADRLDDSIESILAYQGVINADMSWVRFYPRSFICLAGSTRRRGRSISLKRIMKNSWRSGNSLMRICLILSMPGLDWQI